MKKENLYNKLIEAIFFKHYKKGSKEVTFEREELTEAANKLGVDIAKNLGDIIYSFRYRKKLPEKIRLTSPKNNEWIIRPAGRSKYKFCLTDASANFLPYTNLVETKILDSTPGVINKYALTDEQSLLAILRYNRLVDIFTGLTCYSLQNHLRTFVPDMGQVETDELYIGMDKRGVHYVMPLQAKGKKDILGTVQIEQDIALCQTKFPTLICKPIAAQFMSDGKIAMFEFENTKNGIRISEQKHYRLVKASQLSEEELQTYRARPLV